MSVISPSCGQSRQGESTNEGMPFAPWYLINALLTFITQLLSVADSMVNEGTRIFPNRRWCCSFQTTGDKAAAEQCP